MKINPRVDALILKNSTTPKAFLFSIGFEYAYAIGKKIIVFTKITRNTKKFLYWDSKTELVKQIKQVRL